MKDTAISNMPIEKLISRKLKRAFNIMYVEIFKIFKGMEITISQFDLMETILLSEETLTIQALASKTLNLQPNITKLVVDLENKGMATRTNGKDRRTVIVRLTPKGIEMVKKFQKPLLEMHYLQFKNLSKEEVRTLYELLVKITQPDNSFGIRK